jgi:Concanavalin A-like lectin/glucanases superfamily
MSYLSTCLTDSPIWLYLLNAASGSVETDHSGNGNDGTINGTVSYAQAAILADGTKSMGFDGSTAYVSVPSGVDPTGWSALTIECWFYLPVTNHGGRVVDNAHTDAANTGYELSISDDIAAIATTSGTSARYWTYTINTLTPYYYAISWDGSNLVTYIGDAGTLHQVDTTGLGGTILSSGFPTNIGRGAYNNDYFQAHIGPCAMYHAGLSSARLTAHYLAGLATTSTRTVTATAALLQTSTRTVTATAVLLQTTTRTITATAALLATSSRTVTSTAALLQTATRTVTSAAAVLQTKTRTITSTAAFLATSTRPVTVSTALLATGVRTVTATAALLATATRTIPATATLLQTATRTVTASVTLTATSTRTVTASVTLTVTSTRTISASAALAVTSVRAVSASVSLVSGLTIRTIPVTAALQATSTRSITATAALIATNCIVYVRSGSATFYVRL